MRVAPGECLELATVSTQWWMPVLPEVPRAQQ
jgi:hypothetical protein